MSPETVCEPHLDAGAPAPSPRPLVAPLWHTGALIAMLLAIAAYGAWLQASARAAGTFAEPRGSLLPFYLSLTAAEWGLLRFVCAGGLRRKGKGLRDLVGARWTGPREVARDLAIAMGSWAAWVGVEALVLRHLPPDPARSIGALLPRDLPEAGAWVLLSLSAGFCEEAVFRGYLQTQFRALTGSSAAALAAQAVVFGVSHGYQGLRNVVTITLLGAAYGALALWRRSLKPGMILHAWTDVFSGLVSPRL